MTPSQRSICETIIHGHAVAAAAGNAIPGVGIATDVVTMTTMAMALASVFGGNIAESVAKNMAISAIKTTMLKQPIKTLTKELTKIIPFLGPLIAPAVSVAMLESAGWVLANEMDQRFG